MRVCATVLVLATFLLGARSTAAKRWVEARSKHFTFLSSMSVSQTKALAHEMEIFRAAVASVANLRDADEKLATRIVMFSGAGQFKRFGSRGAAGYFLPTLRGNYMVIGPRRGDLDPKAILFHEYVHYMLRTLSSFNYPLWYEEGLAEMLSTFALKEDRVDIGNFLEYRTSAVFESRPFTVERLLTKREALGWPRMHFFVARAWAFVHYLHFGYRVGSPNRALQIQPYLTYLNEGASPEAAARRAFDADLGELDRELRDYLKRVLRTRQVPVLALEKEPLLVHQDVSVRSVDSGLVRYDLGRLALQLGAKKTKLAEKQMKKVLEDLPEHAGAHAGLGMVRLRQGNYEEADSLFSRAVSLGPDDAVVRLDYGNYLLARASSEEDPRKRLGLVHESRTQFARCVEIDPDLPACYVGYGLTYFEAREDLQTGIQLVEKGAAVLPSSTALQLQLGQLYGEVRDCPRALSHVDRVLRWSKDEDVRAAAQEIAARCERS